MAEFTRQAKAGSSWSEHDLTAYNISTIEQDQQTFFDEPLPDYTGPPDFAQKENITDDIDPASAILITHLKYAARGEESGVDDFMSRLLQSMRYESRHTFVPMRWMLQLDMCGEEVFTEADICLIDCKTDNMLLVVQEDKSHLEPAADPQAQLVASAIAVFQMNNANRVNNLSLPALESEVIAGITVRGTFPRFYKIHVVSALDRCVREGVYPAFKTTVHRHTPRVQERTYNAMVPLANRVLFLGLYEAFKNFVFRKRPLVLTCCGTGM